MLERKRNGRDSISRLLLSFRCVRDNEPDPLATTENLSDWAKTCTAKQKGKRVSRRKQNRVGGGTSLDLASPPDPSF